MDQPTQKQLPGAIYFGFQWAAFWTLVGLLAGAAWRDELIYGGVFGALLGARVRTNVFRFLLDAFTFRKFQFWRHPDV